MISTPKLEFPCDLPVKIIGRNTTEFHLQSFAIISKHFPEIRQDQLVHAPSKKRNYISITVTVHATSKQQMDALYQDLSAANEIIMAL